ncbi:MAG: DEAD/DEAH box helicase [Clostridia bacterium]
MNYMQFLDTKQIKTIDTGFDPVNINPMLFDFQKDIVNWACKKGRAAIFADCGLGKTPMQLEWARQIYVKTGKNILILAPLAVSKQTQKEGKKFNIKVNIAASQEEIKPGINITNYEKLHKFNLSKFIGIVLDESSILKSFSGKIRTQIIDTCKLIPYKLACTATPAPNDFMELGNHAEFLEAMNRTEMLATYFIHDGGDTAKWRLKGHAEIKFWEWISSWAAVIKSPSDLGYSNGKFKLPKLNIIEETVQNEEKCDTLIPLLAQTLEERRKARKSSMKNRIELASELVNNSDEQWLIWCDFNEESKNLTKGMNEAIEVTGSDTEEHKTNSMMGFTDGTIKALVTKPKIAGFGMNWQNCHNIIFCGLSDSYEQFYQAIRRCWRFGQTETVNVYVIIGAKEITVINNIKRKEKDAEKMSLNMLKFTKEIIKKNIKSTERNILEYKAEEEMILPRWIA